MRYLRGLFVLFFLIGACVAVYAFSVSFAQNTGSDFRIEQMLRNKLNPSVVAFELYGSFERDDVVNLYSNDVFIKAKVLNTPELVGAKKIITIDNISVDVFTEGDNLIEARIERRGIVVDRTPAFRLTVQEPPPVPVVEVLVNEEKGLVGLNITGPLRENDIVRIFLNDVEVRAKTVVLADVLEEVVQVVGISLETFVIGENFFTASVRRGEVESARSQQSEPIVVQDPEEERQKLEVAALLQCATYDEPNEITAQETDSYEGFGNALTTRDGVLVVGTRGEKTHIYTKMKQATDASDTFVYSATLLDQSFKQSGSVRKSVFAQDRFTVLVGDPGSGYVAESAGAVQVYKRFGDVWTLHTTIAPADLEPRESFGSVLASDGRLLAVTASQSDGGGVVYVYSNIGGRWGSPFRIVPNDTASGQEFGYSVSVSDSRVAVGAPGDGPNENGAVYVYTQSSGEWVVEKIVLRNQRLQARFGNKVLLHDGMLFVGALRNDQTTDRLNSGVVYVYIRGSDGWRLVQTLTPRADDVGGEFGTTIARAGNMLAIGAPRSDFGQKRAGAVYLYKQARRGAQWSFDRVLTLDTLRNGDRFGATLVFDGLDLFIGSYGVDGQEKNVGAVYEYTGKLVACVSDSSDTPEQKEEVFLTQAQRDQVESDFLGNLQRQKEALELLASKVSSAASQLGERIRGVYDGIAKQQEGIVIYDEDVVLANAQRRAAEVRGIIGPSFPRAVAVQRVDSPDDIPAAPTKETVRTRESVIRETERDVGIVVPVSHLDLQLGDVHEDVYRLQVFLNNNGYRVAEEGDGSPGNETSVFDHATDQTLRWFQLVEGLPVTGVLDRATRDRMLARVTSFVEK